jgi:3-oxoacyl-[acyl-carrier protein] reductase
LAPFYWLYLIAGQVRHQASRMNTLRRFSLEGKVAVVTGSSRGIGRAIAEGLAEAGAAVVVNGRNPETAKAVVAALTAAGGKSIAMAADVGKPADVERLMDAAVSTYGRLDILVTPAYLRTTNPRRRCLKPRDEVMRVNLKGVFLCCQRRAA